MTRAEAETYKYPAWRRASRDTLGRGASFLGANGMVNSVLMPSLSVAGRATVLGAGAGLVYGGYRLFKREEELISTAERHEPREARLKRLGRYAGSVALNYVGISTAIAAFSGVGLPVGAVLVVGGAAMMAGANLIRHSSFETTTAEPTPPQESFAGQLREAVHDGREWVGHMVGRLLGRSPQPAN